MPPENQDFRRYEPKSINLGNKNSSPALLVEFTGRDKKVLEVGTSTGYISKILQEKGNKVTGIEIDPEAAAQAENYCEQMIVGDVEELDLDSLMADRQFDVIVLGDVLEHLRQPAEILKKLKPLLKANGYLVVSLPNLAHGDVILNLLSGDFKYTATGLLDRAHLRFFTLKGTVEIFSEAGYEITGLSTTRSDIGTTEINPNLSLYPKELVAFLKRLPDSDVYQFVFKAHLKGHAAQKALSVPEPDLVEAFSQGKDDTIARLEEEVAQLRSMVREKDKALADILSSRGWNWLTRAYRFRDRLLPPETRRKRAFDAFVRLFFGRSGQEISDLPNIYRVPRERESLNARRRSSALPSIDVVIVTYNSADDIEKCLKSLAGSNYDLKKINVFVIDNASSDGTVDISTGFNRKKLFKHFEVIKNEKNKGFGPAVNQAAAPGGSDYIFVLNPDSELHPDCLKLLTEQAANDREASLWEPRQLPYEHPKFYSPLTLETIWSSGAAFLVRRDMFQAVKGFEESLFLYAEDVDLSFKIRNCGSRCRYVPKAVVWHYSYAKPHEIKPLQQFYSLRNNLLLRYRFGSLGQIVKGYVLVKLLFLRGDRSVSGIRRLAFKALFSHLPLVPRMIAWRSKNLKKRYFKGYKFFGFDYELHKSGAFHECSLPSTNELVSVIVRTTNRPDVLREALRTVANQTYPNIEVIVVEDGPAVSEQVVAEFRELLEIKYYSTTEPLGRCKAGNKGLELAKGTYINFLDDDDLFYADHVETLVAALQRDKDFKAAHSACYEAKVRTKSQDGLEIVALHPFFEPFDRGKLKARNLFPIQVVAFHRSLYEQYGGFDEKLELLEDWDLWLRYSKATDFLSIPKTTSEFRTPADPVIYNSRRQTIEFWHERVVDKNQ